MISKIDAHEATLESIKYDDDIISDFLIRLFKDNLLKNTFIFLMRNRSWRQYTTIYYLSDFYTLEKNVPVLFIIINNIKVIDYNQ